jgi:hypothetical protein
VAEVTAHHATGDFPHQYSALVLAALSAGPGSDLQQQLFSLLSSITKIGSAPAMVPGSTAAESINVKADLIKAAGLTAAALVSGAVGMQQPHPSEGGGGADGGGGTRGPAAAASVLPGVLIVGRCCIHWARQLDPATSVQAEQLQLHYERWILR